MPDMFTDSAYSYNNQFLAPVIRGVLGGHGTWIPSDTRAKYSSWRQRTTADYYFCVQEGEQYRRPWPGSDPTAAHIPVTFKNQFAERVSAWHDLTEEQKATYRRIAADLGFISGFNLWMHELVYV